MPSNAVRQEAINLEGKLDGLTKELAGAREEQSKQKRLLRFMVAALIASVIAAVSSSVVAWQSREQSKQNFTSLDILIRATDPRGDIKQKGDCGTLDAILHIINDARNAPDDPRPETVFEDVPDNPFC